MNKPVKGNWPLYSVWIIVLILTVIMTRFYRVENSSFYGIAETREVVVNVDSAVEIKRVHVTEGQSILQGMLMVELDRPELKLKINQISHQLEQLRAQKGVDVSELRSRIRQLTAEKTARENEIRNRITQLENQYTMNRSLRSGLKSIPGEGATHGEDTGRSPIALKIQSLKEELNLSVSPLEIQIDLLEKTLENAKDPVRIQVERLEKELALLHEEIDKLNIYAQNPGIIGSVNYKPGEKVSPFSPILTLHTKTPSFVKGYIYENAYSGIGMGDCVKVASLAVDTSVVEGCVVGVGSRIVEYPIRLKKHPSLQVWGREVVIRIPEDNDFLLGEKVLITSSLAPVGWVDSLKAMLLIPESMAENSRPSGTPGAVNGIRPIVPLETQSIEASAILYLDDIGKYMVLSDDTPGNRPFVLLMDPDGRITKEVVISGLDAIDDMEAAAVGENNTIYITSSLSTAGKKASGRLLVSVLRRGDRFFLMEKVDLHSLLKHWAAAGERTEPARFVQRAIAGNTLNIEGMAYRKGDLYLGVKTPFYNHGSVILKIRAIDQVVSTGDLPPDGLSVWNVISLSDTSGRMQECITDLCFHGGVLYMTGVPEIKATGERRGSLWRFDEKTGAVVRIYEFMDSQPEGVAPGLEHNTLMLCFDQGKNDPSKAGLIRITL